MVDLSRRQSERSLEAAKLLDPVICCLTSELNEHRIKRRKWIEAILSMEFFQICEISQETQISKML